MKRIGLLDNKAMDFACKSPQLTVRARGDEDRAMGLFESALAPEPARGRRPERSFAVRLGLLLPAAILAAAIGHAASYATALSSGAPALGRGVSVVVTVLAFSCLSTLIALLPRAITVWLGATMMGGLGGALVIDRQLHLVLPRGVTFSVAALSMTLLALLALVARRAPAAIWRARHARLADLWPVLALGFGLVAATAVYVLASRRILFFDPTLYWSLTDRTADLVRDGQWATMVGRVWLSAGDDYSLIPTVLPGILTAQAGDQNLLAYMLAVAACYVLPSLIAIGVLGFDLARSVAPDLGDLTWRTRVGLVVLGGLGSVALLPHFLQIFLRDVMLDGGGVVLIVALAFAWRRLAFAVLAPPAVSRARHVLPILAAGVSVGGLSVMAFAFRRWYVFDVLGIAVASGAWLLVGTLRATPHQSHVLRNLGIGAATAALTGFILGPTMIGQWTAQWGHRDYIESNAAWWLGWTSLLPRFKGEFGYAVPMALGIFAAVLLWRGRTRALLTLLILATIVAVVGFLQVQTPSDQHFYLMMPLLGGLAASATILAARRLGSLVVLAVLAPALWFLGLAPRYSDSVIAAVQPGDVDLRPAWNADETELVRLGQWLAANVAPGRHYCTAASSFLVNWSKISNTWQIDRALRGTAIVSGVEWLPEVDTRDGPPDNHLQSCDVMITAEPPQTHLSPQNQQNILLLLDDITHGRGVGQAFSPTGVIFQLPGGIVLTTYRMTRPITPQELQDIRSRFYATKGAEAARYQQRFGPP